MAKDTEFTWVDSNLKGELPGEGKSFKYKGELPGDGSSFNVKQEDGNDKQFDGFRAGIEGDVSLLKVEKQLSDEIKVACSGPTAGAALGVRMGTENSVAAIVEPSLVKAEGQVGVNENVAVCGSVGLNATTGVKVNQEGFKAGFLGFGVTFGVGGKYTIDTPFASVGACSKTDRKPQTNSNAANNTTTNADVHN